MRKMMSILACLAACSLGISTAFAGGPGCSGEKKVADARKGSCGTKTASTCSVGEFPRLVRLVGDREVGCPMTAAKLVKEHNAKVVFAVADQRFDNEEAAWNALANESEMFVRKYTTVSFVKEGKTYFVCDEGAKACAAKTASCSKSAEAKSASCSKGGEAKVAAMDHGNGGGCGKSAASAKLAKSGDGAKATCSSACSKGDGKGACCQAKMASTKSGCCKSKAQAVAVIDTKTCQEICNTDKNIKFMVAGHTYAAWDDAVKAQTELRAAAHKVQMAYLVNGEKVGCSTKVCPKAKAAGQVKYVVGEKQIECEIMARVELARAQYEAAKEVSTKTLAKI
ncbi:MAG TPA: hypothetical protein VNT79_07555 [Phycisphaerae bacterium]|nr:hypothetical protein [Phycisphaerae bacterium]